MIRPSASTYQMSYLFVTVCINSHGQNKLSTPKTSVRLSLNHEILSLTLCLNYNNNPNNVPIGLGCCHALCSMQHRRIVGLSHNPLVRCCAALPHCLSLARACRDSAGVVALTLSPTSLNTSKPALLLGADLGTQPSCLGARCRLDQKQTTPHPD